MKTALMIIDIQNIYFTKGPFLLNEPEKAAAIANKVLSYFRKNNLPVVHVQHDFGNDGYSESKEYLIDFHEAVAPLPEEKTILKKCPSAFLGTNLREYLVSKDIENIVIVGMMSHMCVDTTVRACQDFGYKVTVIEDACTTMDLNWKGKKIAAADVHEAFMTSLNGAFAKVVSYDDWQTFTKI